MFKISVDRKNDLLVASLFTTVTMDKPVNIIKGKTAEAVYAKIVKLGLVTQLDHAAYLGNELGKSRNSTKNRKRIHSR